MGSYLGEVISNKEGSKRGVKYDRMKCSYLMENCDCHDVDSTKYGTLMRFINRGRGRSVNIQFVKKICRRMGGHQIGVFAKQKIAKGTELLVDYGSDFL